MKNKLKIHKKYKLKIHEKRELKNGKKAKYFIYFY
jgi:hypothetical protein